MGIKSILAKPFAKWVTNKVNKNNKRALSIQEQWMQRLIKTAKATRFGKDHSFVDINSYEDFRKTIPVRDYEQLKKYIDPAKAGEANVLWPGKPLYWSKTSGTTSGVKYIPVTRDSIPFHIRSARNALLAYIAETGNASFVDGKLIFLSGSPELETINGIHVGRLSGIVNHHVPAYLKKNQMPSYETNCIEDWEQKVDAITKETIGVDMRLISGIPPWVQMYFDRLEAITGKKTGTVFPNFNLFVYGGVNIEPYRAKLEASIGRKVDSIQTYPASEGFIAYQDMQKEEGMLLLTDNGIFFEFIPVEEYFTESPTRISLAGVEVGKNYAVLLNTNAGLFGYSIGDTVRFVSLDPYRIVVTGRIKHFISAFGEHVIGEEVEQSMLTVANLTHVKITEFTVAPQVNPIEGGLPYHEWFVEFGSPPADLEAFANKLDQEMCYRNIYYKDLIEGKVLQPLKLRIMPEGAFIRLMKDSGKLGGQNKVPRLSNERQIADKLSAVIK